MKSMIIGGVEVFVSDCNIAVEFNGDRTHDLLELFSRVPSYRICIIQGKHAPDWLKHHPDTPFASLSGNKKLVYTAKYALDSFPILHELGHIHTPLFQNDGRYCSRFESAYQELLADAWAMQRATLEQVIEGYRDLLRIVKDYEAGGTKAYVGQMRLVQFETYLAAKR